MNAWVLLYTAIMFEVIATSSLNASQGCSKIGPTIISIIGYGCTFYLFAQTLRTIPIGVAYAIWSGVGIVLITIIGWVVFSQKLNLISFFGIALILAGAIILNLFSNININH